MRMKYCSPFRKLLELKTPLLIMGVAQGRLSVAGVPQVPGKTSCAVLETPLTVALEGVYSLRILVPKVFGWFALAQDANSGLGKVRTWLPVEAEERSGSIPKKKKKSLRGMMGPPIVAEKLLLWNGL